MSSDVKVTPHRPSDEENPTCTRCGQDWLCPSVLSGYDADLPFGCSRMRANTSRWRQERS